MDQRRRIRARTPVEWGVRILLAAAAALAGYFAISHSVAYWLRGVTAERAHRIAPWDGRATAALARRLSGPDATPAARAESVRLARLALRQDAMAVPAITTLGIAAQLRGDTAAARRLFAYSEKLSRRDFITHLWAIEDAVSRNDIAAALDHYDAALRTTRASLDVLFPVLASAISDPAIRQPLIRRMRRQPDWAKDFVSYLSVKSPDPRAAATLFRGLQQAKFPILDSSKAKLINALLAAGQLEVAWQYYASIRPNVSRYGSRDPYFINAADPPAAFDWVPTNDGSVSASMQRDGKAGVFYFAAPPGVGGVLLTQVQMLPPGDYLLEGRSSALVQPETTRPYWALKCRGGAELGRVGVPNSSEKSGAFAGRFRVPASCHVQELVLVARPSDMVSGLTGQIHMARLRSIH